MSFDFTLWTWQFYSILFCCSNHYAFFLLHHLTSMIKRNHSGGGLINLFPFLYPKGLALYLCLILLCMPIGFFNVLYTYICVCVWWCNGSLNIIFTALSVSLFQICWTIIIGFLFMVHWYYCDRSAEVQFAKCWYFYFLLQSHKDKVTASVTGMHHVWIILTLTFIQLVNFKVTQILIVKIINAPLFEKLVQAMPIKFGVKIVWLKVYIIFASLMILTFTQGHKFISKYTNFVGLV